eukprot:1230187-Amphidinium_carterae.1
MGAESEANDGLAGSTGAAPEPNNGLAGGMSTGAAPDPNDGLAAGKTLAGAGASVSFLTSSALSFFFARSKVLMK